MRFRFKVRLHVTSMYQCSWKSWSKFNIVFMVTVPLADRMGSWLIQSTKVTVTIGRMIIFDGVLDGDGEVTCKHTFSQISAAFVMTTCYLFLTLIDKKHQTVTSIEEKSVTCFTLGFWGRTLSQNHRLNITFTYYYA